MKKIIIFLVCLFPLFMAAQGSKIGVRAGLNYSFFDGETEVGEDFSVTNGFHFGINYSFYFNQYFGIRTELLYNQRGNTQNYAGDAFYLLRRGGERLVDYGTVKEFKLEDSNAYLSVPFSASLHITKKFEIYGGISFDFLISPSGAGFLDYESNIDDVGEYQVFFIQTFDNNYYSDEAARISQFSRSTIAMIVDGDRLDIPRTAAAYYFLDEKDGNKYKWFDTSLHLGANYFLNTGFFVGANINYGLTDVTNNEMDFSIRELNEFETFSDDTFVRRDDSDHQISIHASIGFRF